MYGKQEFWKDVWVYGTLFPGELPSDSLAELAGFQPRRGPAFDLSQLTVPRTEIRSGGPPKDGIPALSEPRLISADQAAYLQPDDRVLGVIEGKDARAYPLKILNYHEIVNDDVGETPIAVTYCPLCDSAAVFDRRTPLGKRDFGVSGFLYNSNVLMYDRGGRPESLWSQVKTQGISGPAAEQSLKSVPLELTTWSDWRARHPHTQVLSPRTGHDRDYSRNPYGGYFETPQLMFPVQPLSDRLPTKQRLLGVWSGNTARAYPESAFSPERTRVEDEIDGKRIIVEFNPQTRSLRVAEAEAGIEWMYSLWFAWYAFHPKTDVFGKEEH
ncbi:MAG: DUF3179 domain-containing protein [Planctomycetaceae bacterium]